MTTKKPTKKPTQKPTPSSAAIEEPRKIDPIPVEEIPVEAIGQEAIDQDFQAMAEEDSIVTMARQVEALPLEAQSRVRISTAIVSGLQALAERSRARGQINEAGQVVISPEEFQEEVIVPICQVLARDLQELGVSLDTLIAILSDWWTRPREEVASA